MKSAAARVGASSSRAPSGCYTITSDSGPSGEVGQCPTTTRVPDAVPTPRIQPSKTDRTGYSVVARPPSTGMTAPVTYAPARLAR